MALRYKHRRDTAANYTSNNPILKDGELAFETDTGKSKLGDGVTAWNSLSYTAGGGSGSGTKIGLGERTIDTTLTSPAGQNEIRFDNLTTVTEVYLHEDDENGTDRSASINEITATSQLKVRLLSDPENVFKILKVVSQTDNTGSHTLEVTQLESKGDWSTLNGQAVSVNVDLKEDISGKADKEIQEDNTNTILFDRKRSSTFGDSDNNSLTLSSNIVITYDLNLAGSNPPVEGNINVKEYVGNGTNHITVPTNANGTRELRLDVRCTGAISDTQYTPANGEIVQYIYQYKNGEVDVFVRHVTVLTENQPPTISSVTLSFDAEIVGGVSSLSYSYSDPDSDSEDISATGSEYELRSYDNTSDATNATSGARGGTLIDSGSTGGNPVSNFYTVQSAEENKYLMAWARTRDSAGNYSQWTKSNISNQIIQLDVDANSIHFDGSVGYAESAASNDFKFGDGVSTNTPFTVYCEVKADIAAISAGQSIWTLGDPSGAISSARLFKDASENLTFTMTDINGSTVIQVKSAAGELNTTSWLRIMAVHTGEKSVNGMKIYIENVDKSNNPIGTSITAALMPANMHFMVGVYKSSDTPIQHWDGLINNVKFWNRALTSAERTAVQNYGPEAVASGGVARYGFESDGTDSLGNHDLTLNGVLNTNYSFEANTI